MRTFFFLLLVCFAGQQPASAEFWAESVWEGTWSKSLGSADAVVLGEWVSDTKQPHRSPDDTNPGPSTYKILEVVKDVKKTLTNTTEVTLKYYYGGIPGEIVLFLGFRSEGKVLRDQLPVLEWDNPIPVTKAGAQYVKVLLKQDIPAKQRLDFFVDYLEHPDEFVANDACREFANARFEEIQAFSEKLPREKLREWVADKNTDRLRLGLYGQLLGVCGNEQDAQLLEDIIKRPLKRDFREESYGIMSGYLLLKREKGLKFLEETRLKAAANAPFGESYYAMQAVIFAWDYADNIEKDRLKQSMRLLLDNPDFAYRAITYLSTWKDWEVQDKLMKLYDDENYEIPNIKPHIVHYLLWCSKDSAVNDDQNPTQEHAMTAKKHLGTLREKDPETVKQAERYFNALNP